MLSQAEIKSDITRNVAGFYRSYNSEKFSLLYDNIEKYITNPKISLDFTINSIPETLLCIHFAGRHYLSKEAFDRNEAFIKTLISFTEDIRLLIDDFDSALVFLKQNLELFIQNYRTTNSQYNNTAIGHLGIMLHLLNYAYDNLPKNWLTKKAANALIKKQFHIDWDNTKWNSLLTTITKSREITQGEITRLKTPPSPTQPEAASREQSTVYAQTPEVVAGADEELTVTAAAQITPTEITQLISKIQSDIASQKIELESRNGIYVELQDICQILSNSSELKISSIESDSKLERIKELLQSNNIQIFERGLFGIKKFKTRTDLIHELAQKIESMKSQNLSERLASSPSYVSALTSLSDLVDILEELSGDSNAKFIKLHSSFSNYLKIVGTLKDSVDFQDSNIHQQLMSLFLMQIKDVAQNEGLECEIDSIEMLNELTMNNLLVLFDYNNKITTIRNQIEKLDSQAKDVNFFVTHAELIQQLQELLHEIQELSPSTNKDILLQSLTTQVNKLWAFYAPITNQLPTDLSVQHKISLLKQIVQAIIDFFRPINALSNQVKKMVDNHSNQIELVTALQQFLNMQKSRVAHKFLNAVSKEYKDKFAKLYNLTTTSTIDEIAQAVSGDKTVLSNKFSLWALKNKPEIQSESSVSLTT